MRSGWGRGDHVPGLEGIIEKHCTQALSRAGQLRPLSSTLTVECKVAFCSPALLGLRCPLLLLAPLHPLLSLSLSEMRSGSGMLRFESQARNGRPLYCPPGRFCSPQLVPVTRIAAGQRPSRGWGFRGPLRLCCRVPQDTDTPCLLLRCLRILGEGPGEDRAANGTWKLLGSNREPGGGSAAGAAGVALQKGRRMGRSWGAGGRGRRGLKGRRAQVGLLWSLAISDEHTFYPSSLPCSAPSGAPDPSTVSAGRRLGGCERLRCWEEGTSLRDQRKFPGSSRGPEPSVSPYSLFRRCGNAGWR